MDDLLVASAFVDNLDEVLAQYDMRGPIARQIGQSLAEFYDRRIFRVLDQAAEASSPVTGEPGGFEVNLGANNEYNAQALVDGFFEAAARLDEVAAPQEPCGRAVSPTVLCTDLPVDTNILNRDLGAQGGSLNTGEGLYEIAGIKIYKSNNIPFLTRYGSAGELIDAAVTGENNDYGIRTDFTNSRGLIFHKDAAGVVEATGPSVQTTGADTKILYQGDVMVTDGLRLWLCSPCCCRCLPQRCLIFIVSDPWGLRVPFFLPENRQQNWANNQMLSGIAKPCGEP